MDLLSGVDRWVFVLVNSTLANPVTDWFWPLVTDYDKLWPVRVVLISVWLWLLIRGGARGRTAALLLIPILVCGDQLGSSVLKPLVARLRPCQLVDGIPGVQPLHLLVSCGPGKSFPSSHAVNNFAVATLFAVYYARWRWWFYGWAAIIALSRIGVGVHYPSDVLGGAVVGTLVALGVIAVWTSVQRRLLPSWGVTPVSLPGFAP